MRWQIDRFSRLTIFSGYPVIYETSVAWGEMDAFQHVNNVVYFRSFESARLYYLEQTPAMAELAETGIGPILHSINCRFRFPLTYPDRIQVGVRVMALGEDRFTVHHCIVSANHDRIAAPERGRDRDVRLSSESQGPPTSATLAAAIAGLEGW